MDHLPELMALLGAALVAVPLFKRLRLGAILGYLAAGVVVGPSVLEVVHDVELMLHIAELGVVFFLFLVGLELEPSRLWALRRAVFGLGNAQLIATAGLVTLGAVGLGAMASGQGGAVTWSAALVAGLGLSLSSTAIALQVLAERGHSTSKAGLTGFSILLFQDLAIVPILAVIPVLAGQELGTPAETALAFGKIVGAVALVVLGGRLVMRPVFRFVASSKVHELSTSIALLVVLGAGALMTLVGMSMALGAFLAGVLLADSEYRHELEAAIEPFKGLLLGLFFMSIGMSLDLGVVAASPLLVVGLAVGLMMVKALVLYGVGAVDKVPSPERLLMAASLSQGGEFAFVLFGVAAAAQVLTPELSALLVVVVSLSMALTPAAMLLADLGARHLGGQAAHRDYDAIQEGEHAVIIAGLGRFGQIVARLLTVNQIGFVALDANAEQVDFVRKFGNKLYFGDASRIDLLRSAKADKAKVFVLAIEDPEQSLKTATVVRKTFPHLRIIARARNRAHAFNLLDLGVEVIERELFHSSLKMAEETLVALGKERSYAAERVARFARYDEELLRRQHLVHHDEALLIQSAKQASEELKALFEQDAAQL